MDDPNITMEEYIRLEEEKARKHGKVFNWETANYGKIWYDEDIHDPRSVETKFPATAFNDDVSSEKTLSCEPTVNSLNDKINFKISFDNSDDEDYTVVFDKNLFSYKIISTNDLKTGLENDNEKVMPSLPSPEPTISCFDDLYFFKGFKNEFSAIVYNDAQRSRSDLLTELIFNPQHIDEFDLNNKTSLSEYDEEEQNVLYFNDLFPFNIIHLDDLKSYDMALPPHDQRYQYLRYEGLQYMKEVHRVHVFDFRGLPELMADGLSARMLMKYRDAQGLGGARRRLSWRQFILSLGLHTNEEMETVGFGAYWAESARQILDKGDLRDYWIGISSAGDFLGTAFSYTSIREPILRVPTPRVAQDVPVVDKGGQTDPTPVQGKKPPPPASVCHHPSGPTIDYVQIPAA
ncbi:hypothetical protein Tco_0583610 [Tanacetum coccineum]